MKKLLVILILLALLLVGCSGSDNVIEISERFFITQMTEINMNAEEHVGRTIRYEGMFQTLDWSATGEEYHMVIRYILGCCGDDGFIGYEVYLGDMEPFPDNAWVEVTGELEWYEVDGMRILRVVATSIREMDERGSELVTP